MYSDKPVFAHYGLHVKYLIVEVKNKLNNIIPQSRTKRGLINFVGITSKLLFQTMNSDHAE